MDITKYKLISCVIRKNKTHIDVYRDAHGKFFVRVDGVVTQKRLTASEIVSYLMNAMEGN